MSYFNPSWNVHTSDTACLRMRDESDNTIISQAHLFDRDCVTLRERPGGGVQF